MRASQVRTNIEASKIHRKRIYIVADLASQPTPVQAVYSWFADNKLLVNRRYQRKLVWTTEEKQKLIESIIKNIQSQLFYWQKEKDILGHLRLSMDYKDYMQ